MIKLTVLGSGSCIPYPGRGNSGYILDIDGHLVLMDGGSGALRRVADYGYDYRKIEYILYSHLHPDHTFDFVPLLFALKNDHTIPDEYTVKVIAPAGFTEYTDALFSIYGNWIDSERLDLQIEEQGRGATIQLPFATVQTGPVKHTEASIAYRIEDKKGNVLVYSGDTGYSPEFSAFAQDADFLIVETAIPEDESFEKHSSPGDAGRMAAEANAKRVMFTHFYPVMEDEDILPVARQYYHDEIILAEDGKVITIGAENAA
jgi:ribonuclease BN (tRNA processing enzyme)